MLFRSTLFPYTTLFRSNEVSCLKAMLTLMLQAMGQADAGRVMLKMEKQLALIEDETQAAVFSKTVKQIKQAYRQ